MKIVVIGGGTGTYTVLSGLRDYPHQITAVISMADSGGSNRILRDEFGILPTSDIRQALVALADEAEERDLFRKLFTYRFHQGVGISGMTFGNLFMAALADILGSQVEAIAETAKILNCKGKILPVTLDDIQLLARYENGLQVIGEHWIDEPKHDGKLRLVELVSIPTAKVYKTVLEEIAQADLIILGPGDLFTSIIANLIVGGMAQALQKTKAKLVFVVNIMTKYGQTYNYKATDFVTEIEKYVGRRMDKILINSNTDYPQIALKKYQKEKAIPVEDDLGNDKRVVRADLMSEMVTKKVKGDSLIRSLLRHDGKKLARVLVSLE